jgi:GST-like protein
MQQPIDLYYWPTPNGWKVSIFLEEIELPYNLVPVDITQGDQFEEEFLQISPNNKMPAIVDSEGPDGEPISLFESGAILMYLADKTGMFYPQSPRQRYRVLEWLMFQMGSVGPMLGQANHFNRYAPEDVSYARDRYTNEAARLFRVIDAHLAENRYFAGEEYTIADVSVFPWLTQPESQGQRREDHPNLARWYEEIESRPAVQRGLEVGKELRRPPEEMDEAARETLFGSGWRERR